MQECKAISERILKRKQERIMSYGNELATAIDAVSRACDLSAVVQHSLITSDTVMKGDRSPVTVADLGGQAVISLILQGKHPNDVVIGEESTHELSANEYLRAKVSGLVRDQVGGVDERQVMDAIAFGAQRDGGLRRFWTLDPIDGTKGFLRGEQYAVALGLIEDGEVVVGVLGCPNYPVDPNDSAQGEGCLFFAVRGEGSYFRPLDNGKDHKVAGDGITDSSLARFCESFEKGHASHEVHARISEVLGLMKEPYRLDSQVKYAAVGRGDASIYLRLSRTAGYREKIWDHAAGTIIVEEAGGKVSDFSGARLDFTCGAKLENNVGILATNGKIHDEVLSAIREAVV